MNWLERALLKRSLKKMSPDLLGEIKKAVGPLKDDSIIWKSLRLIMMDQDSPVYPYSQSIWVYSSVHTIAQNISRVPFSIYDKGNGSEKPSVAQDGELVDLFDNPNPSLTVQQLFEATLVYLGIRGESIWVMERGSLSEVPKEIWVLDPLKFEPTLNKSGVITKWTYKPKGVEGDSIDFNVHEIVHFKYFNPYNPLRGLSPLEAAATGVDQDFYASQYNTNFFKEGAVTSGFIETENEMSPESYTRLRSSFEDRHKGYKKAHKIGILEGGAKFKDVKLTQRDMEFIQLKKLSRQEIFAAFKTNEVVLGIYESIKSYEGVKMAHKTFWQECLIPKISYIEQLLDVKFFRFLEGGRSRGAFDLATVQPLQKEFKEKVDTGYKLFTMGYPINMINDRLDMGMDEVGWGDTGFIPANTVPVEQALNPPEQPKEGAPPPPPKDMLVDEIEPVQGALSGLVDGKDVFDDIQFYQIWKKFAMVQRILEKKYNSKLRRYLFEQRKKVLANLYDMYGQKSIYTKDFSDMLIGMEAELERLKVLSEPIYKLALQAGAEGVAEEIGLSGFQYAPIEQEFLGYMEARLRNIPPKILGTIQEGIRKSVSQGLQKGEDVTDLARRVREVYNMASSRALTIARTETATAINAGRVKMMHNQGIKHHRWITARDQVVRPSHRVLEGVVTEVGRAFPKSSLRFPGDPNGPANEIINCRCDTIPVEIDETTGQVKPARAKPKPKKPPTKRLPLAEKRIRAVEDTIRFDKKETAIFLDKNGKELWRKPGTARSVRFTGAEMDRLREMSDKVGGMIDTHNHPGRPSVSFSGADLHFACSTKCSETRATSADYVHIMRPKTGRFAGADAYQVEKIWERSYKEARKNVRTKFISDNNYTSDRAFEDAVHLASKEVAKQMGWVYKREKL